MEGLTMGRHSVASSITTDIVSELGLQTELCPEQPLSAAVHEVDVVLERFVEGHSSHELPVLVLHSL